jgi:hypothetical protein
LLNWNPFLRWQSQNWSGREVERKIIIVTLNFHFMQSSLPYDANIGEGAPTARHVAKYQVTLSNFGGGPPVPFGKPEKGKVFRTINLPIFEPFDD